MNRSTLASVMSLVAGWIVVGFYAQHQPMVVLASNVEVVSPFNPFTFLAGAMLGITLVYLENAVRERVRKA